MTKKNAPRFARQTPVAHVIEHAEAVRDRKLDAAKLDALLAAGKRLKPPPSRLEAPQRSAGELALRRERRTGVYADVPAKIVEDA